MIAPIPAGGIPSATRCSCGQWVTLDYGCAYPGKQWVALCRDCYDGTEDAGERAHVRGYGETSAAALWEWQEQHDDAHEVEWTLSGLFADLERQLREERERQRGWVRSASPDDNRVYYGPAKLLGYAPEAS